MRRWANLLSENLANNRRICIKVIENFFYMKQLWCVMNNIYQFYICLLAHRFVSSNNHAFTGNANEVAIPIILSRQLCVYVLVQIYYFKNVKNLFIRKLNYENFSCEICNVIYKQYRSELTLPQLCLKYRQK